VLFICAMLSGFYSCGVYLPSAGVHFFHPVLNCKSVEINVADYFWLWFVNLQVVLTSIFL